ncbi:MAG: DUF2628 domain-containing protein [Wolinella sp.]
MFQPAFSDEERGFISAYVQSSDSYYQEAFTRFRLSGGFTWQWSWWAFFGGPLYLLYRKLYLEAILLFMAGLILHSVLPFFGSLAYLVIRGGVLPYFVYLRFLKTMQYARNLTPDITDQEQYIRLNGGTSGTVLALGLLVYAILWLGVILALGVSLASFLLILGIAHG